MKLKSGLIALLGIAVFSFFVAGFYFDSHGGLVALSPSPTPNATITPYPSPNATMTPYPSPSPNATITPYPSPSPNATITPTPVPSCNDSDGGRMPYLKGRVFGIENGRPYSYDDLCWGPGLTWLLEYYCRPDKHPDGVDYNCTYGCVNGACVNSTPTPIPTPIPDSCNDSDGGIKLFVKGVVTSTFLTNSTNSTNSTQGCNYSIQRRIWTCTDYCANAYNVKEFYCVNPSTCGFGFYDCRQFNATRCIKGACVR